MPIDLSAAIEHHRQGRLEQAARLYEAALAQTPEHPETLHLLGLVTLQRGDPGRAAAFVSRAIAVRSTEAAYHATLAEAFWALGQLDRTVSAYQSALGLQPDHPEYRCNLGATLIDLGVVDEAIAHFREAIRLRPDFAAAHNNLGNALRLQGDRASAIEHFRKAVQLDPVSAEARSNLGVLPGGCQTAPRLPTRADHSRQRPPGAGPARRGPGVLPPGHSAAARPGWPPRRAGGLAREARRL